MATNLDPQTADPRALAEALRRALRFRRFMPEANPPVAALLGVVEECEKRLDDHGPRGLAYGANANHYEQDVWASQKRREDAEADIRAAAARFVAAGGKLDVGEG